MTYQWNDQTIQQQYEAAAERYRDFGVDADAAIENALNMPISLHCWQADDIGGFEVKPDGTFGGGIMATGNYPGRASCGDEVRADLEQAMRLIPGTQRVNIHAHYAETGGEVVDRDELEPEHFSRWVDWARDRGIGLDFNTTFFAHPQADDGFTLSHADDDIREFWIRHGIAGRRVAEYIGREIGPCTLNHWLPDGAKDLPADRFSPRIRLRDALDRMLDEGLGIDPALCVDFVESKLFGIGSEEFVVGSAEFYANYALSRKVGLCMDMGHFHPTETIHGKISSHLAFHEKLLLHVSRPIRWDSDHVVLFSDDVRAVFHEIVRGGVMDRVRIALDFFDASINRIMAYVIGTRATRKAMLYALLEPSDILREHEQAGRHGQKLALMEEMKSMPFGPVWDMLCLRAGAVPGAAWMAEAEAYEREALAKRGG